jgi:hypothetical protein
LGTDDKGSAVALVLSDEDYKGAVMMLHKSLVVGRMTVQNF